MCSITRLQMFACSFATPHSFCHLLSLSPTLGPLQKLGWVRVTRCFSFVCVLFLCFFAVCLRPVYCVTSVAGFSGLSILDCPFGFLYLLFVLLGYLYFPLQYLYANVVLLLYIYLTFSLILFKNQQFECIPHPILT